MITENQQIKNNYKIISVTPAGRRRYLEILLPYLLKNRKYLSEHHFWVNTNDKEDIEYIYKIKEQYPDFFKINRKEVLDESWLVHSIGQYFQDHSDEGTIYFYSRLIDMRPIRRV